MSNESGGVAPKKATAKETAPLPISRAEQRRRNAAFFNLKPSDMIGAILDDLNAVERSKDFVIDMGVWVSKTYDNGSGHRYSPEYVENHVTAEKKEQFREVCAVCLAGAVMTKRLGVTAHVRDGEITPDHIGRSAREINILGAIDGLRCGNIAGFVEAVIGEKKTAALELEEKNLDYLSIPAYRPDAQARYFGLPVAQAKANRAEFKRDLRRIAKKLASLGV